MKKACLALLLIVLAGLTACTVKQESVAPGTGGPSISDSGPEGSGNTSQEPEKLPANGQMADYFTHKVLAFGQSSTLALRQDGTVYGEGSGPHEPYDVGDWSDIVSIYAGGYLSVGVKSDGTLVVSGKNDTGQAEIAAWKDFVELDMGTRHTVGSLADGTVVAVGDNAQGQCDVSDWTDLYGQAPKGQA